MGYCLSKSNRKINMKPNKSLVLATLVAATLFGGGALASAQSNSVMPVPPAGSSARMRGPNIDYLAKQLDLSDDQKVKFTTAFNENRQKMRALMEDKTLSSQDRRSQFKQLREDLNTQLKSFLTDDQYAKWEKLSAHRRPSTRPPAGTAPSTNAPAASKQ